MQKFCYPDDIRPLTAMRFFAALAVVIHHGAYILPNIGGQIYSAAGATGFMQKGYLGVDFFFILSGFVLAHGYGASIAAKAMRLGDFYRRRIARIYPVYAVTLIVAIGLSLWEGGLQWLQIVASFLMVQSWGPDLNVANNQASWSLSAEWMAYLLFPFLLPRLWKCRTKFYLLTGVAAMEAFFLLVRNVLGVYPSEILDVCALRILPEFVFGILLYTTASDLRLSANPEPYLGALAVVILLAICSNYVPDPLIILLLGAAVRLAADMSLQPGNFLAKPYWIALGRVSYVLYLVQFPLYEIIVARPATTMTFPDYLRFYPLQIGLWFISILTAAFALHQWIEKPAQKIILNWIAPTANFALPKGKNHKT